MGSKERPDWLYTDAYNPEFQGYEGDTYQGRKLITRDSEINKRLSAFPDIQEFIVVDDEKQPLLQETYLNCLNRIMSESEKKGRDYKQFVLPEVYNTVSQSIPSSQEKLDKLYEQYDIKPNQKVGLDVYIGNGGVCIHQALLGGYLLERMGKDGFISGRASIERNVINNTGHAWVRYTNSQGKIYIVDTAMGYLGSLEDSLKVRGGWDYRRPEER